LSGATTIAVVAVTGFPATKPYTLILDQDTVNEEVVTVTASSGTTLTVTRGVDGTSGVAHSAGSTVNHGVSARDFDEPNAFINGTGFVSPTLADAKGDLIVATADDTLARLAVGTNGHVVTADSGETGGMKWAQPGATPTQNAQTGTTYTAVLLDAGKTVTLSNASAVTLTIPAQASVSWADNTQLNFLNIGAGTVTITPAADVTINGEPLTLETSKGGSLVRTASNVWTFIPFSSGDGTPGAANFTNAASGDYVSGGISYKWVQFLASGELIVDQAGFADILVIGGGAGGAGGQSSGPGTGGGGAGGNLSATNAYFSLGTQTVTIGAGGAGIVSSYGASGSTSLVFPFVAPGGGGGAPFTGGILIGFSGGSGGGSSNGGVAGSGTPSLGNTGGVGSTASSSFGGGGGGGAGAVGANGTGSAGGAGGAGLANLLTNVSVTRAGGGGGGSRGGTPGAAGAGGGGAGSSGAIGGDGSSNTGGGGGGAANGAFRGGNGGSGIVIVRVVV
jgi:hypothetical protein